MCGICAGVSATGPFDLAFLVVQLSLVNNRGNEAMGLATLKPDGQLNRHVGLGLVRDACHANQSGFSAFAELFAQQRPSAFIGQTRYSTVGPNDIDHTQPFGMVNPQFGQFFLVHNGQIPFHHRLRRELEDKGQRFASQSDSEVLAALIAHSPESTLSGAVGSLLARIEGAYSILVLGQHELVAARDRHGVWPLWYGVRRDQTIVVSSEEPALGSHVIDTYEVPANSVVSITTATGAWSERKLETKSYHRCWLDIVYLSRPDEGLGLSTTGQARYALGQRLAADAPTQADVVVGVPDSGLSQAAGYAAQSGLSLKPNLLTRNRYVPGRSFILPFEERQKTIAEKLSVNRRLVRGQRVVVVDDTIMRSNTARTVTKMFRELGVREIHWRIAAPPVSHPCFYGIDIPTQEELIAAGNSIEEIRRLIGADSLAYLSQSAMLDTLSQVSRGWCTACVDGCYPIGRE